MRHSLVLKQYANGRTCRTWRGRGRAADFSWIETAFADPLLDMHNLITLEVDYKTGILKDKRNYRNGRIQRFCFCLFLSFVKYLEQFCSQTAAVFWTVSHGAWWRSTQNITWIRHSKFFTTAVRQVFSQKNKNLLAKRYWNSDIPNNERLHEQQSRLGKQMGQIDI